MESSGKFKLFILKGLMRCLQGLRGLSKVFFKDFESGKMMGFRAVNAPPLETVL